MGIGMRVPRAPPQFAEPEDWAYSDFTVRAGGTLFEPHART